MLSEVSDPEEQLSAAYDVIADAVEPSGLSLRLDSAVVAGVFSFDKLPMVKDLRGSAELLAAHPVIAAMAGDQDARQLLRTAWASGPSSTADRIDLAQEFLVHDANSSQQRVLDMALSGRHVVIEGPPGDVELDNLVFDLHDRKISRRQVAQRIATTLAQAETEPPVDVSDLHRRPHARGVLDVAHGRRRRRFRRSRGPRLRTARPAWPCPDMPAAFSACRYGDEAGRPYPPR
jgi:hypothetical protein